MSREIKFRAWNKRRKVMGSAMPLNVLLLDAAENPSGPKEELEHLKTMQFTGLQDKNGKDIYEGDIVKYTRSVSHPEFEFVQKSLGVAAIRPSKGVVLNRAVIYYDYESSEDGGEIERDVPRKAPHAIEVSGCRAEIVGNVWENPELLETTS